MRRDMIPTGYYPLLFNNPETDKSYVLIRSMDTESLRGLSRSFSSSVLFALLSRGNQTIGTLITRPSVTRDVHHVVRELYSLPAAADVGT